MKERLTKHPKLHKLVRTGLAGATVLSLSAGLTAAALKGEQEISGPANITGQSTGFEKALTAGQRHIVLGALMVPEGSETKVINLPEESKVPQGTKTWDLDKELKDPLVFPKNGNTYIVPDGQQADVSESFTAVPGHPDEVRVEFGKEENGKTPPSEVVHGHLPDSPAPPQLH